MTSFPKEVNVLLSKAGFEKIQNEEWGAFDLFRKIILENNQALEGGLGIRLARPFYERFLQHILMFDDVFRDLETLSNRNETAIHILDHIKSQLSGKHYVALKERKEGSSSTVYVKKGLIQRVLARRAEKGSMEAMLKAKFIKNLFEEEGEHFVFHLRGETEFRIMRDTLAYTAMVEALQTSSKPATRVIGDRLAKENYLRIMLAHNILDAREGFRVKAEELEKVRNVLEALDRDQNGLLSLHKAGEFIDQDISPHENPELWLKLRSYDTNGDGFLTSDEQIRLKEAIAGLIKRGVDFNEGKKDEFLSFEEVERVLVKELPFGSIGS